MNTDVKIFEHPQFGKVRTLVDERGDPLFVGKDVAGILGYANPRKALLDHVDEEDKRDGVTIRDSMGRTQTPVIINESGVYSLIFSSKLEKAREFKHWVTSEVLPQIRKTGGYIPHRAGEDEAEVMARAMCIMERTLAEKDMVIEGLVPKAKFFDESMKSVSAFPVRVIAHTLNMTAQELNRLLCENKVQYGQSGSYVPYAQYARKGFTKSRTFCHHLEDGTVTTEHRTKWTERGILFITELVAELRRKAVPEVKMIQLTFNF